MHRDVLRRLSLGNNQRRMTHVLQALVLSFIIGDSEDSSGVASHKQGIVDEAHCGRK